MVPRILAAGLLGLWTAAGAQQTYTFSADGTQRHWIDAWECPGSICPADMAPFVDSAWHSTFEVVAPDGDGAFADGVLYTFNGVQIHPYPLSVLPPFNLLVFTVSGNALSFDGTAVDGPGHYSFDGMAVFYTDVGAHHYGPTWHTGTLTLVPEPDSWALLAFGLALVGIGKRGNRLTSSCSWLR